MFTHKSNLMVEFKYLTYDWQLKLAENFGKLLVGHLKSFRRIPFIPGYLQAKLFEKA